MSEQKVLTLLKPALTRALGGEPVHGIQHLHSDAVVLSVNSTLAYLTREEQTEDRLVVLPFIIFPRTITETATKKVTTWLATHRNHAGQISVGYSGGLLEEDQVLCGKEDPDETDEINLYGTINKGLQRIIAEQVGIRILMEGDNEGQLTVSSSGTIVIDPDSAEGRPYVGLLYFGMTPMSTDTYAHNAREDLGYLPLAELKEEHYADLSPWSKIVVDKLLDNHQQHNASVEKTA